MRNIYLYCEGQTEEMFINEILYPYFTNLNIWVRPIVCTTKRTKSAKYRGGVSDYQKIRSELCCLCKQHHNELVTTMFDYYAMPSNTPSIDCSDPDVYRRINIIEEAITHDVGQSNCFFGLMLHEFESLLFSRPEAFAAVADSTTVQKIVEIREGAISPEHINNSFETAPSKRLEQLMPNYAKVKNGIIISKEIGIDCMLAQCKHFKEWIDRIRICVESERVI